MSRGCHFIATTDPVELVYKREILKDLDFDVAMTAEKIGAGEQIASSYVVVSQAFRLRLESLGVADAEYTPVHLV